MISPHAKYQEAGPGRAAPPLESLFDLAVVRLLSLRADRRGVTALEYGIIASILGLVLVTIFKNFGSNLRGLFTTVGSSI